MADRQAKIWDVIVIGTGMGGGTIGRKLAESGLSVLFLEKGPKGARGEEQALDGEMFDAAARRVRGFWPKPVKARVDGAEIEFFAPLGAGVGGSSVYYAATLERPERHDLETTKTMEHPTGGWPVAYDTFRPYFDAAESMFYVNGEEDPLSSEPPSNLHTPPPIEVQDRALIEAFKDIGLRPYQAHMALRNIEGCKQCLGHKCPRQCKMDGRSAGVEPALETGNAHLIDMCDVTAIRGTKDTVTHVEAQRNGKTETYRARAFVLAAGALSSPRLLLASNAAHWPEGCANSSGLVGRNLMFHLTEMFAIFPRSGPPGTSKALGLRDLYSHKGARHGMVQAMGIDASYGEIVHYLNMMFDRSILRRLKVLRQFTRIPAMIAVKIFGRAKVFAGILEDLPYPENRVTSDREDPEIIRIDYQFQPELLARRRDFRNRIKTAFRGQRAVFLGVQPDLNFGHACGTLCFGHDPKTSVLDANCRAHEIDNLYVADSSFMPTSFGVNPSLTIAANALRVADHIIAVLGDSK